MDISKYLLQEILPLSASLVVIGFIVLKPSKLIKDSYIPFILLVLGIGGSFGLMTLKDKIEITNAIIQGVLATGLAVLTHQSYTQTKKKE